MKKQLNVMMGLPGSGKSTYCKQHTNDNVWYVSRDEIRFKKLHDNPGKDYFSYEDEVFKEYIEKVQFGIDNDYEIIFADATQLNANSRSKLLSQLDLKDYQVNIVYINTDIDKCIMQNKLRNGIAYVPEGVIKGMAKSLETLTPFEQEKGYTMTVIEGF